MVTTTAFCFPRVREAMGDSLMDMDDKVLMRSSVGSFASSTATRALRGTLVFGAAAV